MKWLWSRPRQPSEWDQRLAAVERQLRDLTTDWDATYDKFRRLYARLAKRVSDENVRAAREDADNVAAAAPLTLNDSNGRPLGWERDKNFLRKLARAERGST